jgi:glycosyltransferase involved in cell wall biosynthesis
MKVLFVYRVYGERKENPVVDNQIKGLREEGVEIVEYMIGSGGFKTYLKSIIGIRKAIKEYDVNIIHAHYSLSAFVSSFSYSVPVVCSLMGSDVLAASRLKRFLISLFTQYIWKLTIVKSEEMKSYVSGSIVVPNGVDTSIFRETNHVRAKEEVHFDSDRINIIFVATDIHTPVKNFVLAQESVNALPDNYILHPVSNASPQQLATYYNAADLLLLTSDSEGSPNVIKEALACCCPIVSTDVGDVKAMIGGVKKCQIVSRDPLDISEAIMRIAEIPGRSDGKQKVKAISSVVISQKIKKLYLSLLG